MVETGGGQRIPQCGRRDQKAVERLQNSTERGGADRAKESPISRCESGALAVQDSSPCVSCLAFTPPIVEPARAGFERFPLVNLKCVGQTALEIRYIVVGVVIGLVAKERLDHGVVSGDELNHQGRAETRQPSDELSERNMSAENHMVEQGQTQGQVGPAAFNQSLPFHTPPAEIWGRIGHIADKGKNIGHVFLLERAIESLNHQGVDIHCQNVVRIFRRNT